MDDLCIFNPYTFDKFRFLSTVTFSCILGMVKATGSSHETFIDIQFSTSHIILTPGEVKTASILIKDRSVVGQQLSWLYEESDEAFPEQQVEVIEPLQSVNVTSNVTEIDITITAKHIGSVIIFLQVDGSNLHGLSVSSGFILVEVVHSHGWVTIAAVTGWLYTICWFLDTFPQIYTNWKLKSASGLSFDFVSISLIGFVTYMVYNIAFLWVPVVKDEYRSKHPRGVAPVQLNDTVMAIQKVIVYTIVVMQCIIYHSDRQRMSKPGILLSVLLAGVPLVMFILSLFSAMDVLLMLYTLGLIKLITVLIKYVFQIFRNSRRKSTSGFNVFYPILDFTGGVFSLLQIIIIAANGDDWSSIGGNWAKILVGISAVVYCSILIAQHFLYHGQQPYDYFENVKDSHTPERKELKNMNK